MGDGLRTQSPFSVLRRYAQPPASRAAAHCDLCKLPLAHFHRHLLELTNRQIHCACDGCALRFQDVVGGRFKLIPRDSKSVPDLRISDLQWEHLALPIHLAFFFESTPAGKVVALYPSPAGATESLLPLEAWSLIVAENPVLKSMEQDVEALLVNRVGEARDYFIAPIDVCFELAGLIRMHWRGLSGGDAVWREIERFFDQLRKDAAPVRAQRKEVDHA